MKKIFSVLALATALLWGMQATAAAVPATTHYDWSDVTADVNGLKTKTLTALAGVWDVAQDIPLYTWIGAGDVFNATKKAGKFCSESTSVDHPLLKTTRNMYFQLAGCDSVKVQINNGGSSVRNLEVTIDDAGSKALDLSVAASAGCVLAPTVTVNKSGNTKILLNATNELSLVTVTFYKTVLSGPTITATPTSLKSMSTVKGAAIDSADRALNIKGANLTAGVTMALKDGAGVFSLRTTTIAQADAEAANGKNFAVTVNHSANAGIYKDTLLLSSAGATDVKVPLQVEINDPAAPNVVKYIPSKGATNVQTIDSVLYVVYDADIKLNDAVDPKVTIDNSVLIRSVSIKGKDTLKIVTSKLVRGVNHTVTVKTGLVTDLIDTPVGADSSWSFTTDGAKPTLVSKEPEGASNAPIKAIKLVFNEDILKATGKSIRVNGGSVGVTVSGSSITLKDTTIRPLTTYTVEIPAGAITDISGNEADSIGWSFTTMNDAIVFPYTPTVDANFVVPSWMTAGLGSRPNDYCKNNNTGNYVLRTTNGSTPADDYAEFRLPMCGTFTVSVSSNGGRSYSMSVDGQEVIATTAINKDALCGGVNKINYAVNSFAPVTVRVIRQGATAGLSLPGLSITAPVATKPVLSSSVPANGAAQVATNSSITLTYDHNVQVVDKSQIKINNVAVSAATVSGRIVTLTPASALQGNTTYTITAPDSAMAATAAAGSRACPAVNISFTTAAVGLTELPIIVENFQDWVNTRANCDTVISADLWLKPVGSKVDVSLTNCQVNNIGHAKSTPQTVGVSDGFVILGKEDVDVGYPVGQFELPVLGNNVYITKVWFTASATGTSPDTALRGVYLYKKGVGDADWVRVGDSHVALQNGSIFTEDINEANVKLKFTSQNDLKIKQLVHLHDVRVYGMIHPDSSSIPTTGPVLTFKPANGATGVATNASVVMVADQKLYKDADVKLKQGDLANLVSVTKGGSAVSTSLYELKLSTSLDTIVVALRGSSRWDATSTYTVSVGMLSNVWGYKTASQATSFTTADFIKVTGITIENKFDILKVNETKSIITTITPGNAGDTTITWTTPIGEQYVTLNTTASPVTVTGKSVSGQTMVKVRATANGGTNIYDEFTFYVDENSTVATKLADEYAIVVSPNPTSGNLYVKSAVALKHAKVFSVSTGSLVYSQSFDGESIVDLNALAAGSYIVLFFPESGAPAAVQVVKQ